MTTLTDGAGTSKEAQTTPTTTPPIQNPLFTLGIPPWGTMEEIQRPLLTTFLVCVSENPTAPFLGSRPEIPGQPGKRSADFQFLTYSQVKERVRKICAGMKVCAFIYLFIFEFLNLKLVFPTERATVSETRRSCCNHCTTNDRVYFNFTCLHGNEMCSCSCQ